MRLTGLDTYLRWLLGKVHAEDYPDFWKAFEILFHTEFVSDIPTDDNRIYDGLDLRDRFRDETGARLIMREGCSILEMMVAFAERIEFDNMHDPDLGDRTFAWFWAMFDNLGLSAYDDYHFDEEEVHEIIRTFLTRTYRRNGRGGLFTVHNPNIDMRKEELWYQGQYWLVENFV